MQLCYVHVIGFVSNVFQLFIQTVINSASVNGLACDWFTDKLYWTDRASKRVEVASMNGKIRKVLFWTEIDEPRAIALVPMQGLMFWTDWGETPKIERASMNGDAKTRKVIVNENIVWPNGLAIDLGPQRRLYWSDGKLNLLESINLDGSGRKTLLSGESDVPYPFAISLFHSKLFWTDWHTYSVHIHEMIENSTSLGRAIYRSDAVPMDLKVWHESRQPNERHPCEKSNGNCSHFCLLAENARGYSCSCPNTIRLVNDFVCANGPEQILLVARKDSIFLIYLDSAEFTVKTLPVMNIKQAIGIDFDYKSNGIYWTDAFYKSIQKISLSGDNQETIVQDNIYAPDGLFIDELSGNLYWTDSGADRIQVSRLDGTHRRVLIYEELNEPRAICVSSEYGFMFWSDWNETEPKIERAHADGSNRVKLVTKEIGWPNGLAIDFAAVRLYWCDALIDRIESVRFDGSDRKLLIKRDLYHTFGLSVMGDFVYWTDWQTRGVNRVHKSRFDDTIEVIATNIPSLMAIKAIDLRVQLNEREHTKAQCSNNNGGCEHLCLSKPNQEYICACELEYELQSDQKSCKLPELSLFYGTPNSIGRLNVNFTANKLEFPISKNRQIKVFDVDPIDNVIYWSEERRIVYAKLQSLEPKVLIDVDINDVNGLAVDWVSRNLFWSDSFTNKIEVMRLDGIGRKTILWDSLQNPRNIVIDPLFGLIFWFELSCAKGCLKRSQMNGQKIKILDKNIGPATSLAIHIAEKRLFWNVLKYLDDYAFIRSCNYDGTNDIMVYESTKQSAPVTLAAFANVLYWADANTSAVWKGDLLSGSNREMVQAHVHEINELVIVSRSSIADSNPCSFQNGNCTHLCLMISNHEFECACPTHFVLLDNNTCTEPYKFLLISQKSLFIRLDPYSNDCLDAPIPISRLKNAQAIDYDPFTHTMFWIEGRNPSIKRAFINGSLVNNGGITTVISSSDSNVPIDFAIDPLYGLLYWICDKQRAIMISRLYNGTHIGMIVGGPESKELPRMLALHWKRRLVIWTDSANQSQLIRARMDGSYRVVVKRSFVNITAIAVDVETDTIVWAERSVIVISNIEGENQYQILNDNSVSISKLVAHSSLIYWYDRDQQQIQSQDLKTRRPYLPVFSRSVAITDMTIINSQMYSSSCTETNAPDCSHLCIESDRHAVCACPNGLALQENNLHCIVIQDCEPNHFTCASLSLFKKDCIPASWRCDGEKDCPDESDEIGCPSCTPSQFRCQTGQCIDPKLVCDGTPHCPDGFDERHCCKSPQEFQCPHTDVCIDAEQLCDGMENCADGADESKEICLVHKPNSVEATKMNNESSNRSFGTIVTFIIIVIVLAVPVFLLKIRRIMFKTRPIAMSMTQLPPHLSTNGADAAAAASMMPLSYATLQSNAIAAATTITTSSTASEPLCPRVLSVKLSMSMIDYRTHVTGKSSSTNGSSSGGLTYPHITTNPPPSPVLFHDPYRYYKARNLPPPPTPCLTDVCDESDYD